MNELNFIVEKMNLNFFSNLIKIKIVSIAYLENAWNKDFLLDNREKEVL